MMTDKARAAVDILRDYRHYDRRIDEIQSRIAMCRDMATRATSSYNAGCASGTSGRSHVETAVTQIVDLERQMQRTIADAVQRRTAVQNAINCLGSEANKRMLELRYMDGRSWQYIMQVMYISRTTSYRIHIQALEEFWDAYQKLETP